MTISLFRYFLFPHSVLPGSESRHLSILLPNLYLLQAIQKPVIPEWAADRFQVYPTLPSGEVLDRAVDCYRGYHEIAGLHGDSVDLASLTCDWVDTKESRTHIQGTLRGRKAVEGEHEKRLLLEAAVFIEMARELDQQETELEESYDRLNSLEEEFKQIIGIGPEDELDEATQALSQPLRPERSGLLYMLPRRIACWLRLFSTRMPEGSPVLVSASREVIEELLDPVRAHGDRTGKPVSIIRRSLAVIPSLEHLGTDDFRELLRNLHEENVLSPYWQSLENVLREPDEARYRGELDQRVDALRKSIEDSGRKGKHSDDHDRVELTWIVPQDCDGDFWKCIDPKGHEALRKQPSMHRTPSALLCLN